MVRSAGTTSPSDAHRPGLRNSSIRIRLAPQRGCYRRNSATQTSTAAVT